MVNTRLLTKRIYEKQYQQQDVAEQLGLSKGGFSLKLRNRRPFTLEEVKQLQTILDISPSELKLFFFQ